MSQETYTFACPVCAVRLSVPKALAGVRGPCPQCHHEITAPVPESVLAPAMAGGGQTGAPPLPPPPAAVAPPPKQSGPSVPASAEPPTVPLPPPPARVPAPSNTAPPSVPPSAGPALPDPLPSESQVLPPVRPSPASERVPGSPGLPPLPPGSGGAPATTVPTATMPAALVGERLASAPTHPEVPAVEMSAFVSSSEAAEDEGVSEIDETVVAGPGRPASLPRARRSPLGLAVTVLLLVALLAAAALNFLPRQSLRHWLGQVLPSQAGEAIVGPKTGQSTPLEPGAATPATVSTPAASVVSAEPPAIQIRSALDPAEASPLVESDPIPAGQSDPAPGGAPEAVGVATTEPSPSLATRAGSPEPATPETSAPVAPDASGSSTVSPAPAPVPPAPGSLDGGVPPSLLPDISQGASAAPTAADESLAGAQEALTLFLQARNWNDRMALCEGDESLRTEMESYYRKAKDGPNVPTSVEHIASAPLPDGTRTVQVFHVTFPDLPQGFPVPVRQTDEGWKIDWRAFVEFREGRLKKFLSQYQDSPEVFRVRLQRSHQADRAVPNADKKYIFRIAAPIDGHEGYVFVDKDDSIVGPKIAKKLDANTIHLVMAKLKWVRGTNGRTYVELRDIVSESWREAP